ncbi:MAG TPA: penicillin-binding transpeptidase domain-containing protein [Conexibacter sp.]|nr:penicillin-binding transpeptidase domain-containing protein [Conexibacter sp.]
MEAGGGRAHSAPRFSRSDVERRRRLVRRGLPLLAGAGALAVAAGLLLGGGAGAAERATAQRFATAWARGDYARMYALLDEPARARSSFAAFAAAYRDAAATATLRALAVGKIGDRAGTAIPIRLTLRTRVFGTLRGVLELPVSGSGDTMRIAWRPSAVFPGLQPGEQLTRQTALPTRASLLARDGTVLAGGDERRSDDPLVSGEIAGSLASIPADQAGAFRALGYPPAERIGMNGLERVFQTQLAGRPGGTLLAGDRVLARTAPRPGQPIRTTIDRKLERAAITALAGRYGGVAAMDPRTGEVLALAGVAFSALQPPGSTFKIVTLTGALESHLATPKTTFPIEDATFLAGVRLENANGEFCGGTLANAFAVSCNSVFAPLGARLGARRLVNVAERFGFNAPPTIAGAQGSTIPSADAIGDDLAVGSSAIGQGLVQATTLQMTIVAATIADRGLRPIPTLQVGTTPRFVRATRPAVAREVAQMMRAVVAYGTGTAAAIPGAQVAGKTGSAELASTVPPPDTKDQQAQQNPQQPPPRVPRTDAWFVAFAPSARPRIAVGVLFPEAGAGGDVAAPAARGVLAAALQHGPGE